MIEVGAGWFSGIASNTAFDCPSGEPRGTPKIECYPMLTARLPGQIDQVGGQDILLNFLGERSHRKTQSL